MKYTWEAQDIQSGRRLSYRSGEQYIIGYIRLQGAQLVTMTSGRDGQTQTFTLEKILERLNQDNYTPHNVDPDARDPLTAD